MGLALVYLLRELISVYRQNNNCQSGEQNRALPTAEHTERFAKKALNHPASPTKLDDMTAKLKAKASKGDLAVVLPDQATKINAYRRFYGRRRVPTPRVALQHRPAGDIGMLAGHRGQRHFAGTAFCG